MSDSNADTWDLIVGLALAFVAGGAGVLIAFEYIWGIK